MRILVLSDLWHPFPGGAEAFIRRITEALHKRGHEIHILTSYAKAKADLPMTIADIGVYERHAEGADLINVFGYQYKPDLMITHHFFAGEFAKELTTMAINGTPFVELIHNRPRHPGAAFAIFNSHYTAARGEFQDGDMIMLPPATDECLADGLESDTGSLPINRPYIGHIKPLGGKGISLTYALARRFPERKFLVLRGEWQDGEDIQRLPNVEFLEPVDDIREFYSCCRIVLMPSLSEDAGTVPQECALNGIPCISSNVMGLKETNEGGILLPPGDETTNVNFWAQKVEALDNTLYYEHVVNRQRMFIAGLNWEGQFDAIDQKIRSLCTT